MAISFTVIINLKSLIMKAIGCLLQRHEPATNFEPIIDVKNHAP